MNPIEIFQTMVKQDALFVNNHTQNSFSIFKQSVTNTRNFSNSNAIQPQETFTSRALYQVPQTHTKQQSYKKIDEWQKQQDLLVKHNYQNNHFIPSYPQKIQNDLSLRVQRHYAQNKTIDQVKDVNKIQLQTNSATLVYQNNETNQSLNMKIDLIEQPIIQIKMKTEEVKKKSNLKRAKNQTVEKKTVKIEEKRKSISESPDNQQLQLNKPSLPKIKSEKQQEQNSFVQQFPGIETVDQFLQKAK